MGRDRSKYYRKKDPHQKEFHMMLRNRVNCGSNCLWFTRCPYANPKKVTKGSECKVIKLPEEEQKRWFSIFVMEENGLKNEALKTLYNMGKTLDLENDAREMKIYLEAVTMVAKTFKVLPKKKDEPREIEPITIDMSVLKLDKRKRINPNDPVLPPNPDENLVEDGESLYASPKLEGILANPTGKFVKKGKNGNP